MHKVVILGGTSFCGSTPLAIMLDSHRAIVSSGEMQFRQDPGSHHCSCGATIADCRFWREVAAEMSREGSDFAIGRDSLLFELGGNPLTRLLLVRSLRSNALDTLRDSVLHRRWACGRRLELVGRHNQAFISGILAITGKSLFVDGSKDPLRYRYIERYTDLQPLFLHLVRDAPGFVNSCIKNVQRNVKSSITLWNRMATNCTRVYDSLPEERRLRVRYEDLCADPERELNRIASWAGVERFPWPVDFASAEHHIMGNRMRHEPLANIALDESWRKQLTAEQVRIIAGRTERHRKLFGYE
jgi:hypothetical protein